jgi:hypothetical protein
MVTSSIKIFLLFFVQQICQLRNSFHFLYNRKGVRGVVLKWRERETETYDRKERKKPEVALKRKRQNRNKEETKRGGKTGRDIDKTIIEKE